MAYTMRHPYERTGNCSLVNGLRLTTGYERGNLSCIPVRDLHTAGFPSDHFTGSKYTDAPLLNKRMRQGETERER